MRSPLRDPKPRVPTPRDPTPRDLAAASAAAFLVLAAVLIGRHIENTDHTLFANWPPLWASWDPHVGPGTPAAITVALGVVAYGPVLTARLPWRALLGASWAAAMAWTWSLALIDGWHRGVAVRLTTRYEYLQVIDRFHDIPATLRDFTHHIPLTSPDHWPPHVAGHPPAASLTFVLLDRIGLSGGGWAGTWCITLGATACVAVLVTVRRLADEECARRAAPFLVLAPAAVWMGTSADAYFTAAAAWSVAALTLAATAPKGPRTTVTAFTSGLLFGLTCYLSYGLTLIAVIGAGVLFLARSRVPMLPCLVSRAAFLVTGFAVVPTAFTLAGFHWWEAYPVLVERYYAGAGGIRPYGYWVWANLACTVLITGLATAAGLRRAAAALAHGRHGLLPHREPREPRVVRRTPGAESRQAGARARLALLVLCGLLALLTADLSGMSKAETERIWLPFAIWLLPASALLSHPRTWLGAQAVLALLLNHLLLTGW
ncbi:hypothetical protein [Streptomyces tauricus]|uniref:hypothetical protein n=1 Tax=Streptomyces tauricus TaxID=68274 RepID=UPI00224369CE|nr:hypothetical protein [Streptomyces tauricus]MCW8103464.1 hypothetical protein [Streptomyces tauricus]